MAFQAFDELRLSYAPVYAVCEDEDEVGHNRYRGLVDQPFKFDAFSKHLASAHFRLNFPVPLLSAEADRSPANTNVILQITADRIAKMECFRYDTNVTTFPSLPRLACANSSAHAW